MKKKQFSAAAFVVLVSAGSLKAAPILNLSVETSTSGAANSFSAASPTTPIQGTTLFFEIVAQTAPTTATNLNTTRQPNGTTDSLVALPNFTITAPAGSTFAGSTLQNNFNTGSGASSGTTGSNTIDIRAIELGFTENDDTPLVVDSGTLSVGSGFKSLTANTDEPVVNAGSLRVAGSPVAVTAASEVGTDPEIGYHNFTVTPEPASCAILALAVPGLLVRRRRQV